MPECAIIDAASSPMVRLVACVDHSDHAASVVNTASQFAEALGAPLTLFHVLDTGGPFMLRPDPIDADFQRHQSRRRLLQLIDADERTRGKVLPEIVEGDSAIEICRRAAAPRTMLVMGRSSGCEAGPGCGTTTHRVIERAPGPVLVVPAGYSAEVSRLWRLLVPLDGSSFAEIALVPACLIARQTGAEIVLVHVVPDAALTQIGPLDANDIDLRDTLNRRNNRIARDYLDRQQQHLINQGIRANSICAQGDVRSTLTGLIVELNCDMMVISARGQGGCGGLDLPLGNVTSYLLSHANVPLLVVRPVTVSNADWAAPTTLSRLPPRPVLAS